MNTITRTDLFAALALSALVVGCDDYAKHVDVFTGTGGTGHTTPAAAYPFGFVQAGPDTGFADWEHCSGYQFADTAVCGYSQTHISGAGCPDYGDVSVLPFTGDVKALPMFRPIDKATERGEPGYYAVRQSADELAVEITAAKRSSFYRITWDRDGIGRVLVNLPFGLGSPYDAKTWPSVKTSDAVVRQDGQNGLSGSYFRTGWLGKRRVAYAIRFNCDWFAIDTVPGLDDADDAAPRYLISFRTKPGEPLLMKIGLSVTSADAAKLNLAADIPGWDFEATRAAARAAWNAVLARSTIEGTDEQKANWYTALYHLYFQPNDWSDFGEAPNFTTLSMWDTFRAAQPWYSLVMPELINPIVNSLLRHRRKNGMLPVMDFACRHTDCMIGNHAAPIIVDAYKKGFRDYDAHEALDALVDATTVAHKGKSKEDWDIYDRYGYYPFDLIRGESVSRTLECAYDDWCTAELARELGDSDAALRFARRATRWKNVFDPSCGLVRGKDSKGGWRTPYDPYKFGHGADTANDFTEGNAFQYTWHVMQDPEGLMEAMGGRRKFVEKLDELFERPAKIDGAGRVMDVSGLIGQYVHGNEPSHHVIYLYTLAGEPHKAAARIRQVFDTQYHTGPEGLCGNDDCGQMSAWYAFSAMGFYPFNPCGGEYVLGAPQVPEATLRLPNGNVFRMVAKGLSRENRFVKSVTLNGEPLTGAVLRHADIVEGGELVFEMTDNPPLPIRVGTYNVRLAKGDLKTPNAWENRKADLVALVKRLDMDVFGMQEVLPEQAQYFRETLTDWAFVGDHRGPDRKTDEASPVFYRKSRFEALKVGSFWLSETPEVPASKSWGTACTRICSYLVLRDKLTGQTFCFANTHTDHRSAEAREKGMLLVIERMKEFGRGAPIVFTGDHNCPHDDAPAVAVRQMLKDARDISPRKDPGPINTYHHWGDPKMTTDRCRIDYIYVSDGVRVLDVETHGDRRPGTGLYPSDHYPMSATILLPPAEDAADESATDDVEFTRQRLFPGFDGKTCKIQPSIAADGKGTVLLSWQNLLLSGSDVFHGESISRSTDGGKTFGPPKEQALLKDETVGAVRIARYGTVRYSHKNRRWFGLGAAQRYLDEKRPLDSTVDGRPVLTPLFYTVDAEKGEFTSFRIIDLPFDYEGAMPFGQMLECDDGDLLIPFYFRPLGSRKNQCIVLRCRFAGDSLKVVKAGTPIADDSHARGICEPSLTKRGDRYYVTLRTDETALWAESADGLVFSEPRSWKWDDGDELGCANTQQHWMRVKGALWLAYTRRGANNDHVFRNRAPIFMARFDEASGRLVRATERAIVPELGARLGNFVVIDAEPDGSWLVTAEWMQPIGCEKYGSDNTIWLVKTAPGAQAARRN